MRGARVEQSQERVQSGLMMFGVPEDDCGGPRVKRQPATDQLRIAFPAIRESKLQGLKSR
jgi:hypothetical protein